MKTWASAYYRIPTVQRIVGVNIQNSHLTEEWSHNLMCKVGFKNQLCQDSGMNQEPSVLSPPNHLRHTGKSFYFISCCQFSLPFPSFVFFKVSLTVWCTDLPYPEGPEDLSADESSPWWCGEDAGWESWTGIPPASLTDTAQKIKKTEEKLFEDHSSINLELQSFTIFKMLRVHRQYNFAERRYM